MAPVPQALLYGANYAVCFALIFLLGATLATKQPALTASRLADALASGPGYSPLFVERVRAIWRSQFVSFLGNIAGAGVFTIVFAYAFQRATGHALVGDAEAQKLAAKLHPWQSGTMAYAAIAGVMLSAAGFMAGFIDNAMVFHQVSERVRGGGGVFWLVPGEQLREALARRVEASAGALSGNVILGFMLGSAGAFGAILGIPFDIRHIAFGSSHTALALWQVPSSFSLWDVALLFVSVAGIGFINFLVSFSITLAVAINARRLEGVDWRAQMASLWRLMRAEPLSFLLPPS
jgi:site-specific recombinase